MTNTKTKLSKIREVCGQEYIVKWRTTQTGRIWKSYPAICGKSPRHWGKHREVIEW